MAQYNSIPGSGLFTRLHALTNIVLHVPDDMSDEEAQGVVDIMPPDVAVTLEGFMNPRIRRASIAYLKIVGKWLAEAKAANETGKKVIIVPFNFVPQLVHAFENAVPLTSEVLSALAAGGTEGQGHRYWDFAMGLGIPDHLCSASTIDLGAVLGDDDLKIDGIISSTPGACDANAKMHEFVANYLGVPQFLIEKPVEDNERGIEEYRKNFYRLVEELEEFIGERLDEDRLRRIIENCNKTAELHRQLWELRKNVPSPVPNIFNFYVYGTHFMYWGRDESVTMMQMLVDIAKERLAAGDFPAEEEIARVAWLYTGYYIDYGGFFNWMEERGYTYLFDILDLFFPEPISTESRETMIDGICEVARTFAMTRQMGAESMSAMWLDDVIHVAKDLGANAAIYCGHHACKQTWSVISIVQKELMEQAGIPTLSLQGDAWLTGMTPMSALQDDIDEFIRSVVAKKRRGKVRRQPKAGG